MTRPLLDARELVSRSEMWTLMYQQSNGSWHEVTREHRTAGLDYAAQSLAESEKKWPDDSYRLAIVSTVFEFPSTEDMKFGV